MVAEKQAVTPSQIPYGAISMSPHQYDCIHVADRHDITLNVMIGRKEAGVCQLIHTVCINT